MELTPQTLELYFRKLIPQWSNPELTIDELYGKLDVKDKCILDIGADCGSTALYFALKGAKKIYCIEKDTKLVDFFNADVKRDFPELCDRIEYVELNKVSDMHFDIVKTDIEGAEAFLDQELIIGKPQQFAIGLHTNMPAKDFTRLTFFAQSKGAKLHAIEGYGNTYFEMLWIKNDVIT